MTVLFVHGTGVRESAFKAGLATIKEAISSKATVEGCYWGDAAGAQLRAKGASIPYFNEARGFVESFTAEIETSDIEAVYIALWAQLAEDPWWELRIVSLNGPNPDEVGPDGSSEMGFGSYLLARATEFKNASNDTPQYNLSRATGLNDYIADACEFIARSEFSARCGPLDAAPDGRALLGRAVVATALRMAEEDEAFAPISTDPQLRDELVSLLASYESGTERGLLAPISGAFRKIIVRPLVGIAGGIGARIGTSYVRRRRGAVSDSMYPGVGDILVYQANGRGVRNVIENALDRIEGPVTLLGHSLGGIACVDLLVEKRIEKVKALVTVGSQAPFFYEIGALQTLPFRADLAPEQRLPAHFPLWLNVYDPRDFLSYIGEQLFGPSRVTDIEVNNGLAFPVSHSGYWSNQVVWDSVLSFLAQR